MKHEAPEIADVHLRVSVKTAYKVLIGAFSAAALLVGGWMSLKSDVAQAKNKFAQLEPRVSRIECLLEQANNHAIYGIKPTVPCEYKEKEER